MSTISAGTTNSTALVETGDTTGNLIIKANTSTTVGTFSSTGLAVVGSLTSTPPAAGAFTTLSASGVVSLGTAATGVSYDSTAYPVELAYGNAIITGNGTSNSLMLYNNSYLSSAGYKFYGTGYAQEYYMTSGTHNWRVSSASGTANAAVSFIKIGSTDTTGNWTFSPAGNTAAVITQYGLGLGTAVPSSGIGIAFPATQSASTDANTLDDYEEGTWTPTVTAVTTTGSPAYAGSYVKIGKQVTATMYSTGDNSPTATYTVATNSSRFTLPFTAANLNNNFQPWTGTSGNGSTTAGGLVAAQSASATCYFITAISVTNNICATITYSI